MKTLIAILFAVALLAPKNSFSYSFDRSLPKEMATQIKADLNFMATLEGGKSTPLHKQIFGDVSGRGYKQWFETRINVIGYNSCGGGNAVACVIPWQGSDKMWITDNYIKFSHPQISRLMVIHHEARHSETQNGNWAHADCPTPFLDAQGNDMKSIWTGSSLAGEPACDETPLGSYGSSTILLKNVQKFCTNCTEKVKQDASIYADDQLGRIVDAQAKADMIKDFK
jgi:hypothetical protein